MVVRVISTTNRPGTDGLSQYHARLVAELLSAGVRAEWHTLADWRSGKAKGNPKHDMIVVASEDLAHVQAEYAVVAVQHGCAMESGLRCRTKADIAVGRQQMATAQRKRTLWVASSDWTAHHYLLHAGVRADRIIYGGVDVDTLIPSERQRARDAKRPIVLHRAVDANSGQHLIAGLTKALKGTVELREARCQPAELPDALRAADMWLSLAASEHASMLVREAMSCGLVIVGTNVGVLWPYTRGSARADGPLLGWLNKEIGGVVFPWQQRDYPEAVTHHIRSAWHHRKHLGNGRDYARQWWSLETFGRKWLEALLLATQRFRLQAKAVEVVATALSGSESRARDAR